MSKIVWLIIYESLMEPKPVWINWTGSARWIRRWKVNAITSQIIAIIPSAKIFFSNLDWFWSRTWKKGSHWVIWGSFCVRSWPVNPLTFAATADAINKVRLLSIFIKLFDINNSCALISRTLQNSARIGIRPTAPVSWSGITEDIIIKACWKEVPEPYSMSHIIWLISKRQTIKTYSSSDDSRWVAQ